LIDFIDKKRNCYWKEELVFSAKTFYNESSFHWKK